MDLTPEERQRIYLEEKERMDRMPVSQTAIESDTESKIPKTFLVVFCGLAILLASAVMQKSRSEVSPPPSESSAREVTHSSSGNPGHDQLMAFTQGSQAVLLGKVVGEGCSGNRAFFQGMNETHEAFWSVGCTNGSSYLVELHPDDRGSGKVVNCSDLKLLGLKCFVKLKD